MKKLIILILCLSSTVFAFSQDFNDYQPLKNQGQLPADFTALSSVKYAKDVKKISTDEKKKDKKAQKDFYLNANFAIDGLLKSGKVLYETEYSNYLKDVMAVLLKDRPDLSKKIRIYILRTPSVNAFATADGILFVTLGLLAQVENEAQLAFILSHEIMHVDKKHALKLVLKSNQDAKADDRRKLSRNGEVDDKSLTRNLFSKEHELEADREGYKLFARTNYSAKNINRVFDVLKYSELPFDNIPFEHSFLETPYLTIPTKYFTSKVKNIEGINENENDKHSTHPNLFKRRAEINALMEGTKDNGKKEFVVSKERFEKLQKVSRFEIPQLDLHLQLFQDAIYNAFLLKKIEKSEQYPEIITAKALYGLAKYKNNAEVQATAELIKLDSIEGEAQQVYHVFEKMPNKELTVLATSYLWRASQKYKKNTDLQNMAFDLMWILVKNHKLNASNFSKTAAGPLSTKPKEAAKDSSKMTKIDKIKTTESTDTKDWWQYAFVECLKDEAFSKAFDNMVKNQKEDSEEEWKAEFTDEMDEAHKNGFYLGVPKVVVVNPAYLKMQHVIGASAQSMDINLIESEKNIGRFEELLKDNATTAGVNMTMLNPLKFEKGDIQKFNDFTLLKEWYMEQADAGNMGVSGFRQKEIEDLAKKYDTDYFLWTGVIGFRDKSPIGRKVLGVALVASVYFASVGVNMISDRYEMYYYSILYNVKTGRNYIIKSEEFRTKDSDMLLNAHIYDTFLQIKTEKKDGSKKPKVSKTKKTESKTSKSVAQKGSFSKNKSKKK
jgi:beta-barrel assembly-enhancing protease